MQQKQPVCRAGSPCLLPATHYAGAQEPCELPLLLHQIFPPPSPLLASPSSSLLQKQYSLSQQVTHSPTAEPLNWLQSTQMPSSASPPSPTHSPGDIPEFVSHPTHLLEMLSQVLGALWARWQPALLCALHFWMLGCFGSALNLPTRLLFSSKAKQWL